MLLYIYIYIGMARSMTEAYPPAGRDGPRNWEHADWADRRRPM